MNFELRYDQKYVGTFDTRADAMDVANQSACTWQLVGQVIDAGNVTEVYIGRGDRNAVNHAYMSITRCEDERVIFASDLSQYHNLRDKGYRTVWTGEGKVCMRRE